MKTICRISEKVGSHQVAKIHEIDVEDGNSSGGWYTQITSLHSFRSRCLKRWNLLRERYISRKLKRYRGVIQFDHWSDLEEEIFMAQKQRLSKLLGGKLEPEMPKRVQHNSVWDFYDYIGYDHKDRSVSNIDQFIYTIEEE